MASSEELVPLLPETLPEDFGDWDSEAPAPPSPGHSDEREAWESGRSFSETANPIWKPADRASFLDSLGSVPRASGSASSAQIPVVPHNDSFDHDSESFAMPLPVTPLEWEAWEASRPFVKAPEPLGPSAERAAVLRPALDTPRHSGSNGFAPGVVEQQESTSELAGNAARRALQEPQTSRATNAFPGTPRRPNAALALEMRGSPEVAAKSFRDADAALFQLFSPKRTEDFGEQTWARKKWMVIAGVSVGSVLLLLLFLVPHLHHGAKSTPQQSVQTQAEVTHAQPEVSMPKPPALKSPTQARPPAAAGRPGNEEEGVNSTQAPMAAQTKMMNDQLTAPTRIPKQVAEDAPPPQAPPRPVGMVLRVTVRVSTSSMGTLDPSLKLRLSNRPSFHPASQLEC